MNERKKGMHMQRTKKNKGEERKKVSFVCLGFLYMCKKCSLDIQLNIFLFQSKKNKIKYSQPDVKSTFLYKKIYQKFYSK